MTHRSTRASRRAARRRDRKRFRAAVQAALRGDRPRGREYSARWGGVAGMRPRDLPLDDE